MADHLRVWSPYILEASQEQGDEEAAGTLDTLRRDLRKLDAVAHNLSGRAHLDDVSPSHSALYLVDLLAVSQVLTNQNELVNVVRKCVSLAVPPQFQSASYARLQCCHSKAVPSLTFDMAWALSSRKFYCQQRPPQVHDGDAVTFPLVAFFFWADSSPQGGHDWMLFHCHALRPHSPPQLREALEALDGLCSRHFEATIVNASVTTGAGPCLRAEDEDDEPATVAAPAAALQCSRRADREVWTRKVCGPHLTEHCSIDIKRLNYLNTTSLDCIVCMVKELFHKRTHFQHKVGPCH